MTGISKPFPVPDFQTLFESTPGLYLVLATDFTILAVSDAYLRATMTKREEILGKGIFEVFPDNPNDPAATGVRNLRASLFRVLQDKVSDTMAVQKYDIRKPESEGGQFEERYWSPVNSPVLGQHGQVIYIIHRVEDVTDFARLKQNELHQQEMTEELRARAAQMEAEVFARAREVQEQADALRRSEAQFRALFEFSPDAIIASDAEGHITEANPRVESMFGYRRSELLGRSIDILVPERFRQTHPSRRKEYGASARVRPMGAGLELYARRKDGSEFPVDIMLSPMETADGRIVISVIRDISDRKAAEESIRRSEQQFRALFEFSPDAIIASGANGRITEVNPRVESTFGYQRGELLGQSIDILVPERFRQTHPDRRKQYGLAARVRPMGAGLELYGRRKDGSEFPVDIMLSPMDMGDGQVVISVIRDISDRKKAEEAIRRSEAQFRALFEFSPDAIIASDSEGRITEINARVESMFGFQRGELLGQSIDNLVPERFRRSHPSRRKEYSDSARVRPMGAGLELFGRRKDGTEFPADIMLGPVETGEGRIVLSVIRDLTEKREAEEALRRSELQKRYLEEELSTEASFDEIVGESVGLKRVLKLVETVAATDVTVLILGETGTGKEVIARAIHRLSPRNEHVMVKLNCAAIPAGLLESELFGHERGAFTGAFDRKIGRLELAHEGTLFLDEIGDLPLELQPKILRALQEKEFERLGSNKPIPVNVRLVAATNRDLAKMVADGQFRSDLYYRLRVFPILLPPLRERREDIPLLVRYFVDRHSRKLYKRIETIPDDTMRALTRWDWPGNVRELENFIERAVILTKGPSLRAPLGELEMPEESAPVRDLSLEATEREHILRVLREARGKIGGADGAAARLGLIRTTLNSKMKKLGIERKDYI